MRLKADDDLSAVAPEVQAVLRALKTCGIILADNGRDLVIGGAHARPWDADALHASTRVTAGDLDVVEMKDRVLAAAQD